MTISETFTSIADYRNRLDEAVALLEELYLVDLQLDYLKANSSMGQTAGVPAPEPNPIFVELGSTYPFTERVTYYGRREGVYSAQQELLAGMEDFPGQASSWASPIASSIDRQVSDITDILTPRLAQTNEACVELYNSLATEIPEDFGGLGEDLGAWHGAARDEFVDSWYKPFKDVRRNHLFVLQNLASCYSIAETATDSALHALVNTIEATRQAADEQLLKRQEDSESVSTKDLLSIVSGVTGLIGTVTFFATPVSVTFGTISAVTGLASNAVADPVKQTVNVTGASAAELESSLSTQVGDISTNWNTQLDDLGSGTDNGVAVIETLIDEAHADLRFFPRAPGIDENPGATEFYHQV